MKPIPWGLTLAEIAVVLGLVAAWAAVRWAATAGSPPARERARRRLAVALVFACTFAVYLSNSKRLIQVDTQLATFAAISLIQHGDLDVDEFRPDIDPLLVSAIRGPDGHIYSQYPPGSTLACLPFFLIPVKAHWVTTLTALDALAKFTGAAWTALAVTLLFVALRRWSPRAALPATVAFALGTFAFSTASQDTWQHGPSLAGLALALYLIARDEDTAGAGLALGAALGWAVACRTTDALPAAVLFAVALLRTRRAALWALAGGLPFAALIAWVNTVSTGFPLLFGMTVRYQGGNFDTSPLDGLAGLLVSPSRGLFVYSPFLLLAVAGAVGEGRRVWLERGSGRTGPPPLAVAGLVAAVPLILLVARWNEWHGGWSYGYRIIGEAALLLMPGFAAFLQARPVAGLRRAAIVATVAIAIGVQALQVYFPSDAWNAAHIDRRSIRGAWSLRPGDTQIGWHVKAIAARLRGEPPAPRTLQ